MAEVVITPGPKNSIPEATFLEGESATATITGHSSPQAYITPAPTPAPTNRFLVGANGGKMLNSSGKALLSG